VSIFELPRLNRLIFLTDPGINPALTMENDIETSRDIILNAIDVARSMGVHKPKVAILDANEVPSEKIPTSIFAKELSEMDWGDAEVYGPLSYDLALYEEAAKHKGLTDMPVAGKADILIVPHISGGNFLYKAWAMTMSADVANVVLGAKVPLIITSRSDNDMTKFLTICASAVYSSYKME
jgi:phosphate butyryltransferase